MNVSREEINDFRIKICDWALIASVFFAVPALAISLSRIANIGWQPVMGIQILLAVVLSVVCLFRSVLPYAVRAGFLLTLMFIVGVGGLWQFGLLAASTSFLVAGPIMATVLFGGRIGLAAGFVFFLAHAVSGFFIVQAGRLPDVDLAFYMTHPLAWLVHSTALGMVMVVVLVATIRFSDNLSDALTSSRRYQEELLTSVKETKIASRAKSDLMANMSHELRTPLNAIIGFSETIKEETFGPVGSDKNREYLNDIHQSGQHLLELINDILDVSAIEAGGLELHEENVSLIDIIETSMRLIRTRAEAGRVSITSTITSEIPMLYVDARRAKQVFLNLLSNAVKFTLESGEITVSAHLNTDGSLAVAVADTGIGMDDNEVVIALSTFGQVDSGLDRKHEGTGLGLALTKGLMELHGGTLEIKSEKGKGTLVTVTFPKDRILENVG